MTQGSFLGPGGGWAGLLHPLGDYLRGSWTFHRVPERDYQASGDYCNQATLNTEPGGIYVLASLKKKDQAISAVFSSPQVNAGAV